MKNVKVKYDNLKLKKLSKYAEENEGEDVVKYVAHMTSKDIKLSITKKDPFVGLVVGQEYKVELQSDQQVLVAETESTEPEEEEESNVDSESD